MKERPIIFSSEMIQAILDGRKFQTRRVIKHTDAINDLLRCLPDDEVEICEYDYKWGEKGHSGRGWYLCLAEYPEEGSIYIGTGYGKPGDRLWVKENHWIHGVWRKVADLKGKFKAKFFLHKDRRVCFEYPHNYEIAQNPRTDLNVVGFRSQPSIFMPRWASRINLEITNVRVERLQDISEEDCIAEGVFGPPASQAGWRQYPFESCHLDSAKESYLSLWNSLNGEKYPWSSNPWVWVIEFKRVEV